MATPSRAPGPWWQRPWHPPTCVACALHGLLGCDAVFARLHFALLPKANTQVYAVMDTSTDPPVRALAFLYSSGRQWGHSSPREAAEEQQNHHGTMRMVDHSPRKQGVEERRQVDKDAAGRVVVAAGKHHVAAQAHIQEGEVKGWHRGHGWRRRACWVGQHARWECARSGPETAPSVTCVGQATRQEFSSQSNCLQCFRQLDMRQAIVQRSARSSLHTPVPAGRTTILPPQRSKPSIPAIALRADAGSANRCCKSGRSAS